MAASNRATIIAKTHKVLKKHFKPLPTVDGRSVVEHLLFACCLENSRYDKAEEGFARIQNTYYDWNEIRVATARELAESFDGLADPLAAARNLKRTLQSIFESFYRFDLEDLKKQNLGTAIQHLERLAGTTRFTVAYAVQHGLGGHAIPLCRGSLDSLYIVGAASDAEYGRQQVPGLERAIPKNKGVEFSSLLHQLGCELIAAPFSPKVRAWFLEIAADAKDRLPKRGAKQAADKTAEAASAQSVDKKEGKAGKKKSAATGDEAAAGETPRKKSSGKGKAAAKSGTASSAEPDKTKRGKKSTTTKKSESKKRTSAGKRPPAAKKTGTSKGRAGSKPTKSGTKSLARKKPR